MVMYEFVVSWLVKLTLVLSFVYIGYCLRLLWRIFCGKI